MLLETGASIDLRLLGLPAFSGTVLCASEFETDKAGTDLFRIREMHGSVRMILDGTDLGICIGSSLCRELKLETGRHRLQLELCISPGNHDIMCGEPAGLFF